MIASIKYNGLLPCLLLAGLFLLASLTISGQSTFQVTGKVLDASDAEPLIGAQVVSSDQLGTTTDLDGNFKLDLPSGEHTLRVSMIGFESKSFLAKQGSDPYVIRLAPKSELLDQVVISAGRYEQNVSEVTVSMEVLKPDLLRNRNLTALDDALRETPGMIIVDGEPQIRSGSGYSFGAGSRVQILMDGIPLLSGDVGRPTWSNIPMEAVDQIEVIKGAASVLYGSAALSGVVHVRTLFPSTEPKTRIEAYGGAYAKPRAESNRYWSEANIISGRTIMHAQQIGNSDLVIGIDLLSDDSYLGPLVDSTGAILHSDDVTKATNYDAERRARGWMKYRYRNQKVKGLVYGIILNGQKNESMGTLLWDNTETGLFKSFAGSATLTQQTVSNVNPFIEYRSLSGNALTYKGNWSSLDNKNDNDQNNFSDTYFNELQYQVDGSTIGVTGLKLITGVATTLAKSESQLFNNAGQEPTHESSNIGAYLQGDMKFGERWHASAGLRWEQFSVDGEKESAPVFRAGLNYKAGRATYLRASYGEGFRFPTIGERFISTQVGVIAIYPNPDLQAETSVNMELGLKQGFQIGNFQGYADLAMFQQTFENYIEFTFGPWAEVISPLNFFGLGFSSLNTGSAKVDGVEFSVAARGEIASKTTLSLLAGYTFTKPVSTSPDYIYSARDLGNSPLAQYDSTSYTYSSSDPSNNILKYRMQHIARINADITTGRFSIGMGIRYNSFMQNIDGIFEDLDREGFLGQGDFRPLPSGIVKWREEKNKGDIVLDMRMGYRFYAEHRVSIIVDNLANREYSIRPLALESTRRVMLKVTFEF